ncbi:MAG: hypothetical protein SGJ27_24985 [Candidatus Melainabacteria bacterium]|nr:hypothetical protein [Candidatus Melainabacteria bacterium]
MQLKFFLQAALATISALVLTSSAAQAQQLPVAQAPQVSQEQQMLNNLPAEVKAQMRPGIRYTIGAKTNAGWENSLVKANSGLKHFYWSPVTSMVQASPSQRTKSQATASAPLTRPAFHYQKPIKAALPHNPWMDMPLPRKAVAQALPQSRNSRDVSAKLSYKKPRSSEDVNGELISTDTQAKLYAAYPTEKAARNVGGNLSSRELYGKLLSSK